MIKNLLIILGCWLGSALLLGLLGMVMLDWRTYSSLSKVAIQTTGTVSAKEPTNHRFVRYSFRVNGREYAGIGSPGGINPEFDHLNVGDPVRLFYDPNEPDRSFLGDPKDQLNSIASAVILIAFFGSGISVYGMYVKGWLRISRSAGKAKPSN